MKKSLYEELGVDKKANGAEIKRAYRAKAKKAHPDAGGTPEEFAPIATAYMVLQDPLRRAHYDQTGQLSQKPLEVRVKDYLTAAFNYALSQHGIEKDGKEQDVLIVATVKKHFTDQLETFQKQREYFVGRREKLLKKRAKVSVKEGLTNLFHVVVDNELDGIRLQLGGIETEEQVGAECLKAVETYLEEQPAPPPVVVMQMVTYAVGADNYVTIDPRTGAPHPAR